MVLKQLLLKTFLGKYLRKLKHKLFPRPQVDFNQIGQAIKAVGIESGDNLIVHCSLAGIGCSMAEANKLLNFLLELIGPQGHILVPTFTYSKNQNDNEFHVRKSRSELGFFSEMFRLRKDASRSLHPTHSVAVIGPDREKIIDAHEDNGTPFAKSGPWGKMVAKNAKVLVLGLGEGVMSVYHAIEDWGGVPYRYEPNAHHFVVIDKDGNRKQIKSKIHAAHPGRPKLFNYLKKRGMLKSAEINGSQIFAVDSPLLCDHFLKKLERNKYSFFCHPLVTFLQFFTNYKYYFTKQGERRRIVPVIKMQFYERFFT